MLSKILSNNLSIASILVLTISIYVAIKYRERAEGTSDSVSLIVFFCILFTAGLDIGLIMFPMMEFETYSNQEYYGINPLSLEIGFWGGIVWVFYFLSTFYFVYIEPKIKLFESPGMKLIFSFLLLLTCAFSAKLFVDFFKFYLPPLIYNQHIGLFTHENIILLTTIIITLSAFSALKTFFIKALSYISLFLFSLLIIIGLHIATETISYWQYISTLASGVIGYIDNISLFIKPMNEYHEFYMFWWFSWSLMIGKFISRFIPKGIYPLQLFLFMIIVPTVPLSIWFTICYKLYTNKANIDSGYLILMSIVGLLFMINSFDSAIRVSANLINESIKPIKYNLSLYISYFLLLLFFISYAGFYSDTNAIIKIEHTGTLSIIIIYYILFKVISIQHKWKALTTKKQRNKGELN